MFALIPYHADQNADFQSGGASYTERYLLTDKDRYYFPSSQPPGGEHSHTPLAVYPVKKLNRQVLYRVAKLLDKFSHQAESLSLPEQIGVDKWGQRLTQVKTVANQLANLNPDLLAVEAIEEPSAFFTLYKEGLHIYYELYLDEPDPVDPIQVVFMIYREGKLIASGEGKIGSAYQKLLSETGFTPDEDLRSFHQNSLDHEAISTSSGAEALF